MKIGNTRCRLGLRNAEMVELRGTERRTPLPVVPPPGHGAAVWKKERGHDNLEPTQETRLERREHVV